MKVFTGQLVNGSLGEINILYIPEDDHPYDAMKDCIVLTSSSLRSHISEMALLFRQQIDNLETYLVVRNIEKNESGSLSYELIYVTKDVGISKVNCTQQLPRQLVANLNQLTTQDKSCKQLATHITGLSSAWFDPMPNHSEMKPTIHLTSPVYIYSLQTGGISSTSLPRDCNNTKVEISPRYGWDVSTLYYPYYILLLMGILG
ncbi:hypothetical protein FF38_08184 [Lucilia cuprina]|uniref:Uncharacterized protein n=1 Tax=Lucilia cuprina TaxID=7375 RepID=A0A0L0C363_LUCCU|nr:hypothetical protein FF38_08184 [Lucilia cuprina]